jgi:glutathione synthase/RimK-type ligase-like ATP-grasp enzyme
VLVGSPHDPHISVVASELDERGVDVVVVDALSFPESPAIAMGDRLDSVVVDGRDVARPAAVYLRDVYSQPLAYGVDADGEMTQNWRRTLIAFREKAHVMYPLLGRWAELGVPIYNKMASNWRHAKAMQLALLQEAGLPVPATVWTNDPARVKSFAEGRRVIYKPVAGGAATRELGPEDLTEARLAALSGAPVTFQELLEGENIRVYVLDDEVVASVRVTSAALDYRQNEEVMEPFDLPAEDRDRCLEAARVLEMRWTGIDLKRGADGELRFLELNSSPMFLGFDRNAGTGILHALVRRLAAHAGERGGGGRTE